ncbi:MAG: hypothetical protein AB1778_01960 [Candidatus Bipolaricaulota bacterium]
MIGKNRGISPAECVTRCGGGKGGSGRGGLTQAIHPLENPGRFTGSSMRGTERKSKCGYCWMRIGRADSWFSAAVILAAATAVVCLGYWAYQEMRAMEHRLVSILGIYALAGIFYGNVGVWMHEQLHGLAYRGSIPAKRIRVSYERRLILGLRGCYRVNGRMAYRIQRRALLAPLVLCGALAVLGGLGSLVLPGWWLPVLLSLAVASLADMLHDIYMVLKMRPIGDKGRYWDRGSEVHVVWKAERPADG